MADKIEPVVEINIANIYKQLHDAALQQAKPPKGFVIKNLAFADNKATKMKAGEYLITLAPEDEMDNSLFLDDTLRQEAEKALVTYIKFFVGKDVDPKEFSEILVDVKGDENGEKKDANKASDNKQAEKQEKPAGESLNTKHTKNSLLNMLFEDYQYLNEEGEDKANSKADDKNEKADGKKEDSKPENNKDGEKESTTKVRGLTAKYTCELAGQKQGKLAAAMKKGAKSLFGGIWNDLTQIKITGGAFGKEGLAIGKVLDPDAWKETLGRPDIDANTIKSDIDTIFSKDYPNNKAAVKLYKCSGLLTLIKRCGAKASSALVKAMSDADMCIGIKIQKDDENYDSYNEESIAEVINKSIGNYYKSIITHPLKFKVSKDDIYKVENFNEDTKGLGQAKDTQTPNKTSKVSKESMSFLTYCALINTGKILLEDAEDGEDSSADNDANKTTDSKLDDSKINAVKEKFIKNVETRADASKVNINNIVSEYGTSQDIKIKVKKLDPINTTDIDKIEIDEGTTAFFVDFTLKKAVKDSMIEKYPSMLNKLFEKQYLFEENEVQNTQQQSFIDAINDTAKQIKKDVKIKDDISPIVFNYDDKSNEDTEKKEEKSTGESLSRNLRILKFIYNNEILNEANKKKTDQKKLQKVKELIQSKLDVIRSKYADKKDDFIKYVYSDQGQQLAWTKGKEAENNSFNKFIDEIFSDDSPDDTAKKIASMTSNNNFRNDIIYRFIAPVEKLEEDKEDKEEQEKVKISLFDADPETGEKTGDPIAEFEIEKGQPMNSTDEAQKAFEDANKQLSDNAKDGVEFKGWSKDASEKAEEDTELVAKYLSDEDKDKEFTVVFQYPPDPSDTSKIEEVKGDLGTQKVKAGESAEEPDPPEIPGWKFNKWSDDTSNVTDDMMVVAEYQQSEDGETSSSSGIQHEVYVVIDPYNLAQANEKAKQLYYIYRPKDPANLGDTKKDGSIDVKNGNYVLAQKDPIEKTDDDSFNDTIEKLIPKGYEKNKPSSGYAYDGIEEVKKPKDNEPGIMVMTFKDTKEGEEGYDLYVYASKKIKNKNEKSVGRKEKTMKNGNAYST